METGSSETLIGWISGKTTNVPLWAMDTGQLADSFSGYLLAAGDCFFRFLLGTLFSIFIIG